MSQLPADCINDIYEYLDHITLRSCLLVNRLWCEVAVRILWRDVWNYSTTSFSILIACLPNESKKILLENGIIISTPTSKPPMFNYASFCKVLSIDQVNSKIGRLLQQSISSQNLNNDTIIVEQELYKLFMGQISSLEKLVVWEIQNVPILATFPGAENCLKNLS